MKSVYVLLASLVSVTVPGIAHAQLSPELIQTPLPLEYDRGRNVSVRDRSRPDYDALGIRAGGFLIFPRIDLGLGYSDNVFLTDAGKVSDGYGLIGPSVQLQSDWSRHQIQANAGANIRRYFSNSVRNQDDLYANFLGRVDLGNVVTVTGEAQAARVQEDPFSGQSASTIANLSSYDRSLLGIRGEYRAGRVRTSIGYNHQTFDFRPIELVDGGEIDQSDRDRDIDQISGQFEYALSPSAAVYGNLTYDDINYQRALLVGAPNRSSTGYRAIAGLSLDASGFFRGIIGVGYSERHYDAAIFPNVSGFSAEAQLEYFPSQLTTFTIGARRVIEDSNVGSASAYFDNRVSGRVDHELLRNLILNAGAEYAKQDYIDSDQKSDTWRVRGGARFLMSRTMSVTTDLGYGSRSFGGSSLDSHIKEFQGSVALVLKR